MKSRTKALLLLSAVFLLSGCSAFQNLVGAGKPSGGETSQPGSSASVTNGEEIYFRAVDQQGQSIQYTGGPNFGGMMMGSYLTCVSCHGPEGHGGEHFMHMQVMDAPAINYSALNDMAQSEAGQSGYTLDDFRQEVVQGKDLDGSALSQDMPRWQMSDQDLADLFAFLKTLQ